MTALLTACAAGNAAAQIGPCAQPIGPLRPDLIVDADKLRSMLRVTQETFDVGSCTVVEGCVTSPGTHLLLRFMSSTPNIGPVDLVIGDPHQCLGDLYRFSECHQHLHFQQYSDYRLWTLSGYQRWVAERDLSRPTNSGRNAALLASAARSGELVVGRKQGFCVIDIAPFLPASGPANYVSCSSNQGITAGWADEYHPTLGCQFVQVTGLPEGDYVLEDQVNPEQLFPESDYTNNAAAVQFHFRPKQGRSGPGIVVPADPEPSAKAVTSVSRMYLRAAMTAGAATEQGLAFAVEQSGRVSLRIYSVAGRLVRTLVEEDLDAGEYVRSWDHRDDSGAEVTSGIYFARLESGNRVLSEKLVHAH